VFSAPERGFACDVAVPDVGRDVVDPAVGCGLPPLEAGRAPFAPELAGVFFAPPVAGAFAPDPPRDPGAPDLARGAAAPGA
jgi:hypothetical protein